MPNLGHVPDVDPVRPSVARDRAGIHSRACRVLGAMLPGGQANHRTIRGSEVDVSCPGFRIEIKWPDQWRHGLGQAITCAAEDGASPVLCLLLEHNKYSQHRDNVLKVIRSEELEVELIGLWLCPLSLVFWRSRKFLQWFEAQPSLVDVSAVAPRCDWSS